MITLDWIVLIATLAGIIGYGTWKTRGNKDIDGYLRGGNSMKWATIGLSVMATQASAITFLSTPGQAFESGMGFVQNYFGLPLALIVVCLVFLPIYYRLKVFTAYEYLEQRFDNKTRSLAAAIFLIQRGMGAGITIYAPAIILSKVLDVNLNFTIILVGLLVLFYTVSGGTKAVSLTQKYQMLVILAGLFTAFFIILEHLPESLTFGKALSIAGTLGKLETVDFSLDFEKRYTFWSGITGGFFLSLSYFGADQSQVQRYLGGSNIAQSKIGLMFNALLKIPMQFVILLIGVMVFIFYQFEKHPVFFNPTEYNLIESVDTKIKLQNLDDQYQDWHGDNKKLIENYIVEEDPDQTEVIKSQMRESVQKREKIREEVKSTLLEANPDANIKDSDYVFITFIIKYMPHGVIGLLIAMIFSAAMSSTAGELNALGSTTVIDFYKRYFSKTGSDRHYLNMSKVIMASWGILAIIFALAAQLVENLIEFVNIIGSIFYGTVLGIFLVAFFLKKIKGSAVFIAGIIGQSTVFIVHYLVVTDYIELGYLWYNLIGCIVVVTMSLLVNNFTRPRN